MKVKINSNETYEIQFPDEVGISEFLSLVDNLKRRVKGFQSDDPITVALETPRMIKKGRGGYGTLFRNNKPLFIEFLKAYSEGIGNLHKWIIDKGFERYFPNEQAVRNARAFYISKFNIQPSEIGLTRWRNRARE